MSEQQDRLLPSDNWFIAARTREVDGDRPRAVGVIGKRLALFRDSKGTVRAMEDRCPHKNAALSLGRVRRDVLQCRYHGWKFSTEGALLEVPCKGQNGGLPKCQVKTFPVDEREGYVWVWMGEGAPSPSRAPSYPCARDHGWFDIDYTTSAPLDLVLENGVDCAHTGFVHEGLFRSKPTQFVRSEARRTAEGLEIETYGEQGGSGRDLRSLLSGGGAIRHIDAFLFPHTLKVDYWIGESHVVTVLVGTPIDDRSTRVFIRMGVKMRYLTGVVTAFLKRVTEKIVAQDREILESQATTIASFGGRRFMPVASDFGAQNFQKAYRRALDGKGWSPSEVGSSAGEVHYKL
jgi:phenylpropionate dioxygenase-like ring-hydroxylating dioxygenase large terminal subunit